jgi:hypothetical protein
MTNSQDTRLRAGEILQGNLVWDDDGSVKWVDDPKGSFLLYKLGDKKVFHKYIEAFDKHA